MTDNSPSAMAGETRSSPQATESENSLRETFTQQCRIRQQASPSVHTNSPSGGDAIHNISEELNIPVNNDNGEDFTRQTSTESADDGDLDEKRGTILAYGRDMSDLIILCYTALSELSSQHASWTKARKQLIVHMEDLHKNLKKCNERNVRYEEILRMANACADAAQGVRNPYVSLTARLFQLISGMFSGLFTADSKKTEEESNNILTAVFKDSQASNNLYAAGLQCHQQFEEATKLIERFHDVARGLRYYDDSENDEMTVFVAGMLEYKPNHSSFYVKLHACLKELSKTIYGDFSRRFYEPFTYSPSAVEAVRFLNWRFRYQEFNPESVRIGMEQLRDFIKDNVVGVQHLTARVKDMLGLLKDELDFIETCFKDVKSFNSQ